MLIAYDTPVEYYPHLQMKKTEPQKNNPKSHGKSADEVCTEPRCSWLCVSGLPKGLVLFSHPFPV